MKQDALAANKLNIIIEKIKQVAPHKVIESITLDTSLTEEIALDSIELMDLLLLVKEDLIEKERTDDGIDIERMILYLFAGDNDITVSTLCEFIDEMKIEIQSQ